MENLVMLMQETPFVMPAFLLDYYKKMGLSDTQFLVLLHVMNDLNRNKDFPTPKELSERMELSEKQCKELIISLVKSGIITILPKNDANGARTEEYDFSALYEQLAEIFVETKQNMEKEEVKEINLYNIFEQEFGRALSPIEGEMISQWLDLDDFPPELIKLALKEAVISSAFNFRYIERILFDWKKNGITTVEAAQKHSDKVQKYRNFATISKPSSPEPKDLKIYNWVNV